MSLVVAGVLDGRVTPTKNLWQVTIRKCPRPVCGVWCTQSYGIHNRNMAFQLLNAVVA